MTIVTTETCVVKVIDHPLITLNKEAQIVLYKDGRRFLYWEGGARGYYVLSD